MNEQYRAITKDENIVFRELLFPWYQKMVEIFRDKISLAEPDTRKHFPILVEYVEVWRRFLEDRLPGHVVETLDHREAKLHPFYANLEETHDRLQQQLAQPKHAPWLLAEALRVVLRPLRAKALERIAYRNADYRRQS